MFLVGTNIWVHCDKNGNNFAKRLFTKEEKKRQGPAVYLSLQGNAREAVRIIDPKVLYTDNGYEKVIEALDGIFLKDETTHAFCAIKNFVEF